MAELHVVERRSIINDSAVHMLRDALARAEAGEVECAALAIVYHDGMGQSGFSDSRQMTALAGVTSGLAHSILHAMIEEQ